MSEVRYTGGIDTGCFYGNKEDPGVSACCARPGGFQEPPSSTPCCWCPQPGSLLQGAPAASQWDFFAATTRRGAPACARVVLMAVPLWVVFQGFWRVRELYFGSAQHFGLVCVPISTQLAS